MPRHKQLLSIGLLLVFAAILSSSRATQSPTNINPALLYYQAFIAAPVESRQEDKDYLFSTNWQGKKLDERAITLLQNYSNEVVLLRQAARQRIPCDWGNDFSQGANAPFFQLSKAKQAARMEHLQVALDLQNNRHALACEDVISLFCLGRNTGEGGALIHVLVANAIETIASSTVAEHFYQFSDKDLRQLENEMKNLPPRFTMAESLTNEKRIFVTSLAEKIPAIRAKNRGNEPKTIAKLHLAFLAYGYTEEEWQDYLKSGGKTSDGVEKIFARTGSLYDQFQKIMELPYPDYLSALQHFEKESLENNYPFNELFPICRTAQKKEFEIETTLDMVNAALAYRLRGQAAFETIIDPCGSGSFIMRRFIFQGADRGFQLIGKFDVNGQPESMIFVEKAGPAFHVFGKNVGTAVE